MRSQLLDERRQSRSSQPYSGVTCSGSSTGSQLTCSSSVPDVSQFVRSAVQQLGVAAACRRASWELQQQSGKWVQPQQEQEQQNGLPGTVRDHVSVLTSVITRGECSNTTIYHTLLAWQASAKALRCCSLNMMKVATFAAPPRWSAPGWFYALKHTHCVCIIHRASVVYTWLLQC